MQHFEMTGLLTTITIGPPGTFASMLLTSNRSATASSICDITRTKSWQFELQRKPYLCGRDGFNPLTEITLGAVVVVRSHSRASLRYVCSSVSQLPHYKRLGEAPGHAQKASLEDQLE